FVSITIYRELPMSTEQVSTAAPMQATTSSPRWLTILIALPAFAAGFVSRGLVTAIVAIHRLQYAIHHPETAPERMSKMLQRRLRLTDDQRAEIEKNFCGAQAKRPAVRRVFQPLITMELNKLREEIGAVLTDQQRKQW